MARKTRKNTEREIERELWVSRDFMSPYAWYVSNYEPEFEDHELNYDNGDAYLARRRNHWVAALARKSVERWLGEDFADGAPDNIKMKIEAKIKITWEDENGNILINNFDRDGELLHTDKDGEAKPSRRKKGGET